MSKIEYRSAIKFLFKEGFSPSQIKERLDSVYGDASPSYSTVKNWVKKFRFGRETVEDFGHDGRPVEVLTPETIALIEEEVLNNRKLKIREIAARLGLSKSSVHRAIQTHLNMSKMSNHEEGKKLSKVSKKGLNEIKKKSITPKQRLKVNKKQKALQEAKAKAAQKDPLSQGDTKESDKK